jgi:hypothetical protein
MMKNAIIRANLEILKAAYIRERELAEALPQPSFCCNRGIFWDLLLINLELIKRLPYEPQEEKLCDINALSEDITELDLQGMRAIGWGSVSRLVNLVSLFLGLNSIFDLSPMSGLRNLASLDLGFKGHCLCNDEIVNARHALPNCEINICND